MAEDHSSLRALYPFLSNDLADRSGSEDALLASVMQKAERSVTVKQRFFRENAAQVVATARAIADVYANQGCLLTMGNGGSSCDAAHIAVEFLHPVTAGRPALAALNLVADTATMTAVANDVDYERVFVRQLDAHSRPGDGLMGVSTSGDSANLIAAFRCAKNMGLTTIGLVGGTGGRMAAPGFLDHCLVVETDSIHRIQECHVTIYHILWDLVHTLLAGCRGRSTLEGQP